MTNLAIIQSVQTTELPALLDRASAALLSAKTSAEVLEARDVARLAYDSAKSLARIARAKGAHDELVAKVRQSQADAASIEARASMRLADEYDAAQERGEVAALGDNLPRVVDHNSKATAADIGLRRDEIHAARKLRDAEAADPGKTERVLAKIVSDGEEPTKARLRKEMLAEPPATTSAEPADPAETKLRREFRKLSKEGQEDAYVGLTLDLQESKARAKKLAEEVRQLKEQVKGFDGDQSETIRRQAQTIRHKESEVYRANDKAEAALKQVYALKKRVKELEAMGITL